MKNGIVIIGAGGHGRVCADIAALIGYKNIIFLDDKESVKVKVAGASANYKNYLNDYDIFVAIGDNVLRRKFISDIKAFGGNPVNLIHPKSTLSASVKLGNGIVIMAGSVVNTDAEIGDGVILNTLSSVDHDCVIGEYSHISVGAHLAGTVKIGKNSFIGAGAVVINNITVADDVIIGAGASVIKNIENPGTYIGVPARKIK